MKFIIFGILMFAAGPSLGRTIETKVEYQIGDQTFEGFLAYESSLKGNVPGVMIVHDWLGLTEKTKEKARAVSKLGYVAFAADIYGKGQRPKDSSEAGKFAGMYKSDRTKFRKHLTAALDVLRIQKRVDKKKVAAIGYCFGGTGVIELARAGADVLGAVSFHGGLDSPTPGDGKNIRGKVLALHGADDPFVKTDELSAFETEMRDSAVDWQLVKYGGAVHSFTDKSAGTDNSKGAAYNEVADKRSWQAMKGFLSEVL